MPGKDSTAKQRVRQLLKATWLVGGGLDPQIEQLLMANSFSVHTTTPPVPRSNTGGLGPTA